MSGVAEFVASLRAEGRPIEPTPEPWRAVVPAEELIVPSEVAELRETVRAAVERSVAVYPVGGGTQWTWGGGGTVPGVCVSTKALARLIDYPARDMTITVEAGMRVAELQQTLAQERQWLPIDVPLAQHATVGGSVAANVSGPRRFGYGTLRDYVIGIGVVTVDGKFARAGGRVVKNVAGYDLCKLYTGSFGSLAVIVELTLRVRPQPEAACVVAVRCASLEAADRLLERMVRSSTRPVALELLNEPALRRLAAAALLEEPPAWCVLVGFEGFAETVEWQVEQLGRELAGDAELEPVRLADTATAEDIWRLCSELVCTAEPMVWKLVCRPSDLRGALELGFQEGWHVVAEAANGIAWLWPDTPQADQAIELLNRLRAYAVNRGGNVVVRGTVWCQQHNVAPWGAARDDWWLMRRVKETYDPQGLLNPGRFIDAQHAMQKI